MASMTDGEWNAFRAWIQEQWPTWDEELRHQLVRGISWGTLNLTEYQETLNDEGWWTISTEDLLTRSQPPEWVLETSMDIYNL